MAFKIRLLLAALFCTVIAPRLLAQDTLQDAAPEISPGEQEVSQENVLANCQRWHEEIERLTLLRRNGGSESRMRAWERHKRNLEEEFRKNDCGKYGGKLR